MKIAIMQPYIFPYTGYYRLISLVDKFIVYDDVSFIKNGWINRNRILLNGAAHYITFPLEKLSSNKLINETHLLNNPIAYKKLLKTIRQAYAKAPFMDETYELIENVISYIPDEKRISMIAYKSLEIISEYLGFDTQFELSSLSYSHTKGIGRKERLFKILEENGADEFMNLPGGSELYSVEEFDQKGFKLTFIDNSVRDYKQFTDGFIPNLSIIDVLMFNGKEGTKKIISGFEHQ
jgi:hypothetical protein